MRTAKGYARDRKYKSKGCVRDQLVAVNLYDDDEPELAAMDRLEYDILDRKDARREALAEKRRLRQEHRSLHRAVKGAAKLQRVVRRLQKDAAVALTPAPCEAPDASELSAERPTEQPTERLAEQPTERLAEQQPPNLVASLTGSDLARIETALTEAVADVAATVAADVADATEWETLIEPVEPVEPVAAVASPPPLSTLQRLTNWLW